MLSFSKRYIETLVSLLVRLVWSWMLPVDDHLSVTAYWASLAIKKREPSVTIIEVSLLIGVQTLRSSYALFEMNLEVICSLFESHFFDDYDSSICWKYICWYIPLILCYCLKTRIWLLIVSIGWGLLNGESVSPCKLLFWFGGWNTIHNTRAYVPYMADRR